MEKDIVRTLRPKHKGQAMPLGLAFIMFVSLATILLYNSSQLVSKKSHIANAADAAAYSGLVWQARALNFQAYTNRAMVANQVSIAQFVSLNSWTTYAEISARNADNTIGWIPPVKPFTSGAYSAATQINNIVGQVAGVAVNIISGLNKALAVMQESVYYSTFAITPSIVKEVAKATDSQYEIDSEYSIASIGSNVLDWQRFTKKYDDEDLFRKADIINRSRDRFTANRGWDVGRINLFPVKVHLIKEGSTHLVERNGEWAWRGRDTLSLHQWNFRCKWSGCKWKHNELPIGWGAAYATEDVSCRNCPTWEHHNHRAGSYARGEREDIGGYGGVNPFYDLTDLSADNKDPRLLMRIEVSAPKKVLKTSSQEGFGSAGDVTQSANRDGFGQGMFKLDDNLADNAMASMSSAEVYFERPIINGRNKLIVSGREKVEYGSLWNPYWQVRLVATPKDQRLAAWALRESDIISGAGGAVDGAASYLATQQDEINDLVELTQYSASEIAQLPDRLARQVEATNNLKNIQSSLVASEQEITSLSASLDEGKEAVAVAKDKISDLDEGISEYEVILRATTEQSERDAIEDRIAQFSEVKLELQAEVVEKEAQLSAVKDSIASERDIARSLRLQGGALAGELNILERQITSAQDIDPFIEDAEQLITDTRDAIVNADVLDASGYINSAGAFIPGSAIQGSVDDLKSLGEGKIKDQGVDAATNFVKDAAKNIVKGFLSDQGYNTDELDAYVNDKGEDLNNVKDEVSQNYLEPLEDHLRALKESRDQIYSSMRAELDAALVGMNEDITYYQNVLSSELSDITSTIQPKIDALKNQRALAGTQIERDVIDDKISELEQTLSQEISIINQSTGSTVAALKDRKQKIEADFNAKVAEAKKSIDDDIANLETKIASIKGSIKAG